jgi:hypothetical protein
MRTNYKVARFSIVIFMSILIDYNLFALILNNNSQDDTVYINDVSIPPVIDGNGTDACWQSSSWQPINQVWIPWGTTVDSLDYYGRYKVVWSSAQNLLYFLVEINDDTVSDGYIPGETSAIYNFDMIEVFMDENKSGDYHVFDGKANDETSLGINAENAFGYHIFAEIPNSGEISSEFRVEDLAGTDWAHVINAVYNAHFPEFTIRREANVITREFSLIVYNDTYSESNIEGSRVTLSKNKIMGLSLAFNDDDQPEIDPKIAERDNFFGSVAVSESAYNDHWKNADGFGTAKLISSISSGNKEYTLINSEIQVFPNPSNEDLIISFENKSKGPLEISLLNAGGQKLKSVQSQKSEDTYQLKLRTTHLNPGVYFVQVTMDSDYQTKKFIVF